MKGTRPRGKGGDEDNKLKEELQYYEKFSDTIEKQVQGVLEFDISVEYNEEFMQSFDIMLEETGNASCSSYSVS